MYRYVIEAPREHSSVFWNKYGQLLKERETRNCFVMSELVLKRLEFCDDKTVEIKKFLPLFSYSRLVNNVNEEYSTESHLKFFYAVRRMRNYVSYVFNRPIPITMYSEYYSGELSPGNISIYTEESTDNFEVYLDRISVEFKNKYQKIKKLLNKIKELTTYDFFINAYAESIWATDIVDIFISRWRTVELISNYESQKSESEFYKFLRGFAEDEIKRKGLIYFKIMWTAARFKLEINPEDLIQAKTLRNSIIHKGISEKAYVGAYAYYRDGIINSLSKNLLQLELQELGLP
jgi:hypothetical protein